MFELKEETLMNYYCSRLDLLYEQIFHYYKTLLNLAMPEYGFLNSDCFTPFTVEECYPIINRDLSGIVDIYKGLEKFEFPGKNDSDINLTQMIVFCKDFMLDIVKKYDGVLNCTVLYKKLRGLVKPKNKELAQYYLFTLFYAYKQLINQYFSAVTAFNYSNKSSIQISYRDEGKGAGAFYDHYVFQERTNYPTVVVKSPEMSVSDFNSVIRTNSFGLRYGLNIAGKKVPPVVDYNFMNGGLLVIPGRARNTETKRNKIHRIRTKYEKYIIRKARLQGRPVLGICAGSWQVYNAHGGKCISVKDHCNSRMLRIGKSGDIVFNTQIHRAKVLKNSLLAGVMQYKLKCNFTIRVNSVHWLAPDKNYLPDNIKICAESKQDDKIAPKNRRGDKMKPTEGTMEAFESKFGVPMFGIQWHLEAYNRNDEKSPCAEMHIALLNFMVKAGDAYRSKQAVLREFRCKSVLLKHIGFFRQEMKMGSDNLESVSYRNLFQ